MINQQNVNRYCNGDITLIENYYDAINDNKNIWDCHHRLETELGLSIKELKELGLYYDRPPEELIFLTHAEHTRLHHYDKPHTEDHRKNISKGLKGHIVSEETRKKQRESNLGKKRSEETRKNISKGHLGKESPMKDKNHTEDSKNKIRDKIKGHLKVNNGIINKYILPEELDQYLKSGWSRGFIRKDTNW